MSEPIKPSLLPCPFCGASAALIRDDIFAETPRWLVSCVAKSCANRTRVYDHDFDATATWNRRAK